MGCKVDLLLRTQREREIVAAYRRGYGAHPQEDWVSEAGLAAMASVLAAEEAEDAGNT